MIKKYGYKESRESGEGNMYWYGIALRDNDIDHLKNRVCMLNRYPLMDVSVFMSFYSISQRKTSFVLSFLDCRDFTPKITDSCRTLFCFLTRYKIWKCTCVIFKTKLSSASLQEVEAAREYHLLENSQIYRNKRSTMSTLYNATSKTRC